MRFSLFIAKRYLISKKSHNLINIISFISMGGLWVGTAALIIVLSVFNGFEGVIKSLYRTVDPDLLITVKQGKTFHFTDFPSDEIQKIPGVYQLVEVVEEDALLKYDDKQLIGRIKGVSANYNRVTALDSLVEDGQFVLQQGNRNFAVPGAGVAWFLGINLRDVKQLLSVYVPKRGNASAFSMESAFNNRVIHPAGIFSVQQEIDDKYVFVPLRFARELMDYRDEVTSVEVYLKPEADGKKVQKIITKIVRGDFEVKNRNQQNATLYKVMESEKLAIYLILVFILVLASFNMTGSISVLIVEKKKDIAVLKSMGADKKMVSRIFFNEGLMISMIGTIAGLFTGFVILFLQQQFGLVKLGGGNGAFIINAYPVNMVWADFVYVFLTVQLIGMAASWYPVKYLLRNFEEIGLK
ncbi:MAG: ABC transporter permease [Bacteroidetes bacterium]|nr:MAG: ABC transporter permease [Bacteroidota bacterium]